VMAGRVKRGRTVVQSADFALGSLGLGYHGLANPNVRVVLSPRGWADVAALGRSLGLKVGDRPGAGDRLLGHRVLVDDALPDDGMEVVQVLATRLVRGVADA